MTISVVIPVLNGERYLAEVLGAVFAQQIDDQIEVLVVDSGSTDSSLEIARASGAAVIKIPPSEFGHGRTRNFAIQQTSGELVAFLTQDATPASPNWLAAYADAFSLEPRIGAAYGPHLPRADASPITKRMLGDFFSTFSPDGQSVVHRPGDITYLSNSNSCIARSAWLEVPFRDIPYAEDQALGVDLLSAGWSKVYVPAAAAIHSHDYGLVDGFKRHFDEYRGLRDSVGEKTSASASSALGKISSAVAADSRYLGQQQSSPLARIGWTARSSVFHTGRILFGGLGARADRIPPQIRAALSFERRGDGVAQVVAPHPVRTHFNAVGVVERNGPTPLTAVSTADLGRQSLDIAWVVPPFDVGSGGHTTIFRVIRELEQRGHVCSIWVHDPHADEGVSSASLGSRINGNFMQLDASVSLGFDDWSGCDVAVATGWQTVYPTLLLPHTKSRAYFVQDHEPEFYATSSEALFAERTYCYDLPCIAASPWLADLIRRRYDATATPFELGVDPGEYSSTDVPRRSDTVVFYARDTTPRRAVELGILALAEVVRRRPNLRVVLYGTRREVDAPFAYEHLGIVTPERLRRLYSEATVGLSLSLTNYSLIPKEMMACGLPVVELTGRACESVFGTDGSVVTLAEDDPGALAAAIDGLLDDKARRQRLSQAGLDFVQSRTWDSAIDVIEQALREALSSRVERELRTPASS